MSFEKLAKQIIGQTLSESINYPGNKWHGVYHYEDIELEFQSSIYQVDVIVEYNVIEDPDYNKKELIEIEYVNVVRVRKISENDIVNIPINDSQFADLKQTIKDRIREIAEDDYELRNRENEISE